MSNLSFCYLIVHSRIFYVVVWLQLSCLWCHPGNEVRMFLCDYFDPCNYFQLVCLSGLLSISRPVGLTSHWCEFGEILFTAQQKQRFLYSNKFWHKDMPLFPSHMCQISDCTSEFTKQDRQKREENEKKTWQSLHHTKICFWTTKDGRLFCVAKFIFFCIMTKLCTYQTVLPSRDPHKVAHTPKTAAHKNIL